MKRAQGGDGTRGEKTPQLGLDALAHECMIPTEPGRAAPSARRVREASPLRSRGSFSKVSGEIFPSTRSSANFLRSA